MLKWLFTLALVVFALMWWFGKARAKAPPAAKASHGGKPVRPATSAPQAMVACAHCGLHLPRSDAVQGDGGRWFCGAEHHRLDAKAPR